MKNFSKIPNSEITKIADRIKDNFDVRKIILFGSYAYGSPTSDSDVDFCVIVKGKRSWKLHHQMYKVAHPRTFSFDLILRTEKELHERIAQGDWFLREIVERGKVLYEKAG
ncbi:MAG: nucleotidyltransferase domain-containing protein [Bacteroidota bacterium]